MKRVEKEAFKEAVSKEHEKKWHIVFCDKKPETKKKFKCETLFIESRIIARTVIDTNQLVQILEPGLYLISNPFNSFHLCIDKKLYKHNHIYVGFFRTIPLEDSEPTICILETTDGKINEVPHTLDKVLYTKILDKNLYYLTTISGKACYTFIR